MKNIVIIALVLLTSACTNDMPKKATKANTPYIKEISFDKKTFVYTLVTEKDTIIVFTPYKRGAVILDRKPIK